MELHALAWTTVLHIFYQFIYFITNYYYQFSTPGSAENNGCEWVSIQTLNFTWAEPNA